jgi:restriction system protein
LHDYAKKQSSIHAGCRRGKLQVVTTSEFDSGAIQKAHDAHHTIILIDGKRLVDLMHQYNVGVQIKTMDEVKELDEDFFEG